MLNDSQIELIAREICRVDGGEPDRIVSSDDDCGIKPLCESDRDYWAHYYCGRFDDEKCWHVPFWRTLIKTIRAEERRIWIAGLIRKQTGVDS